MSFYTRLLTIAGLSVAMAWIVASRAPRAGRASDGSIAIWLTAVAASLIVVGIVSETLVRHMIQIAPLVIAMLVPVRSGARVAAAAPLFAFWLLIMAGIWLFLLGVARIFTGTFSPSEVGLTIVIGGASTLGLLSSYRQGTAIGSRNRLAIIAVFAVLQYTAMWLSTRPFVPRW